MISQNSESKLQPPKKRRIWLKILLAVFLICLVASSAYAYTTYRSVSKVIQKNTGISAEGLKNEDIKPEKLKGEGDGRVNILLMGVGDSGHDGEKLSDTLIVASYDPKTHDVAMLGIPRDLYVKIGNQGYSKINNANAFGEQAKEGGGPDLTKQTVSAVLGIPIHYFIRADFTALKQVVDVVGGVDVNVKEDLLDPEYPCTRDVNGYCGFSLQAGPQHLNGSAALKYVRCRKGNCGDDFGRAKRQQDVLVSIREKAEKQNILKNPLKIKELLGVVGNNIRTDLQLGEISQLANIAKDIDQTKIVTHVLDNTTNNLVVTSDIAGASVVTTKLLVVLSNTCVTILVR
jgi:LCP family protein required for cell wall assembly